MSLSKITTGFPVQLKMVNHDWLKQLVLTSIEFVATKTTLIIMMCTYLNGDIEAVYYDLANS